MSLAAIFFWRSRNEAGYVFNIRCGQVPGARTSIFAAAVIPEKLKGDARFADAGFDD
jgi:hypothetical protein